MVKLNIEYYTEFFVHFKCKDGIKGYLAKNSDNEVIIHIGEFIFFICDVEDFDYHHSFDKEDLKKGNTIEIDGVEVEITKIETETVEESLQFWERVETQEMNEYDRSL